MCKVLTDFPYRPAPVWLALAITMIAVGCGDSSGPKIGKPSVVFIVSGENQTATVGTELPAPVVVRVTDDDGQAIPGQLVNFRVVSGNGSVFAGSSITNEQGEARERWTLGTVAAQEQTLEARAVDPTSGEALVFATFHATALPDAGILSIVSGNAQSFDAGAVAAESLTVRVLDKYSNPVPNVGIQWQPGSNAGSVNPASSPTRSDGIAKTQWTTGYVTGSQTVTASASGVSNSPVQFTGTGRVVPARIVINAGDNQSATVGTRVPVSPSVALKDKNGDACCAGIVVTFAVSTGGGSIVGNPQVLTDATGVATLEGWVLGPTPGSNSLVARADTLTPISFSATGTSPHGVWTYKSPMPTARSHFGTAVVNGQFYAFGGTNNDIDAAASLAIVAYNPSTDTWRTVGTSLRRGDAVAAMGSLVYSTNGTLLDVYNTATNTWESKAPLPSPIVNPSAAVVKGILYVTGAVPGHSDRPVMQAYDPSVNRWTEKRPPFSVMSALAVADPNGVGNAQIYAGSDSGEFFQYNPFSDTWSLLPSIRVPRRGFVLVGWNDLVYAIGGAVGTDPVANVEVYRTTGNGWGHLPPMNTPREALGAAVVNFRIYAFGGAAGSATTARPTAVNELFVP